ncbi:Fn3 domain-containing protein [Anseongella ginsenosidimutans]|uniref:Fn3 domain-containing protein n=1 Tax=Anseongella ginsenosidimutans TaxID=496056 RepID=A0A4R3KP53_9SPHI|nr:c-type cytochrome domain-containing protein [Anseongella ginsenosidimutans]QEC52049.1 cytochrome C [Anseongella ginsenosidimutans]TCS85643.1 Fn3 domain-containing protein [Anseongella ginsenosidimutans]
MKLLKNITLNLIFGLNIFILFFVLFEGRIAIPAPLQVAGRMHPLLLHFPIVLLILALVFEFFNRHLREELPAGPGDGYSARHREGLPDRQRKSPATALREEVPYDGARAAEIRADSAGKKAVGLLLYGGAISAALTVVFGLILSKEEGYGGATLNWHKWTGIAISFFAALLLWYQQGKAARPRVLRIGMAVTCLVLLLAGHLGASLTHGENFVLQPILPEKSKKVDLATAVVFSDLVLPIMEEKCVSCHNEDKAKGQLVLTDTAAFLAGGKNGALFEPGDPAASLLMERLLLEPGHKHHMPPKNKPQLSPEELSLIQAWIRSGADFNIPLAALPPNDTIHQLAKVIYDTAPVAEKFDFPAPDPGLVKDLNTAYRVIAPLAKGSPALDVSFFNSRVFSGESLEALKPLSRQVVRLNLSGMPLKAGEFQLLKEFVNLRQLNLNYTPLTDKELAVITQLPRLRSLMLTGTAVTPAGLDSLVSMPRLRHLYVWNTAVTKEKALEWVSRRPGLAVETGFYDDGSMVLPLNKPEMNPARAFFREAFTLRLNHPISGAELRYTLDGSEPDSLNAPVFKEPLSISENTLVKVKAYKKGWTGSETVQTYFHKASFRPDSARLEFPPDPQYKGRGAFTLFDLDNGSMDIRDGKWLGYRGGELSASLEFKEPHTLNGVALSTFMNTGGYIFPPASVEVWGGADSSQLALLYKKSFEMPGEHQPAGKHIYECPLEKQAVSYLKVVVKPLAELPSWHAGKGQPAWVFVDEILLN